ncbi:hypothetical protein SAMN05428976_11331 [Clostridium sp. USBA 49]|nr:hypothetical protein [Clostridium sp. USBA 49]SKA89569.1 hypothetical protein SAMN05428976_11331 [Clostridium sp. USBA 49]
MNNIDWAEEIKRLYFEGYDLTEATKKVLKMIEEQETKRWRLEN